MLKNILNLEGAQKLNREEQKSVSGGKALYNCSQDSDCGMTNCSVEGVTFGGKCHRGACMIDVC